MLSKKVIYESLIIISFSIVIAIIYNALNPNGLGWFRQKSEIVADSLLFNDTGIVEQTKNDTIFNQPILKTDTVKAIVKDSLSENTKNITNDNDEITAKSKGNFKIVSFEQMKRIVESDKFIIIDARQPEAYQTAHIPNSINIFAYEEESTLIPKILSLPKDKTIIVYCDGGSCNISHHLAEKLMFSFGFKRVFLYEGGWEEWSAKVRS
ncbi:MAG: rhodanese-like domain-containing protein [Bacteroidota bacterium]